MVQLQEQVAQQLQEKGAQQLQEKGVIATLDAEQLAGQLCMRLDTAQQGELVGCFQPAELPADPFGFQVRLPRAHAYTQGMLYMLSRVHVVSHRGSACVGADQECVGVCC